MMQHFPGLDGAINLRLVAEFLNLEAFQNVALFEIAEVLDYDSALEASLHVSDIFLEST